MSLVEYPRLRVELITAATAPGWPAMRMKAAFSARRDKTVRALRKLNSSVVIDQRKTVSAESLKNKTIARTPIANGAIKPRVPASTKFLSDLAVSL